VRHSLGLEAALVVALYGVYELARGLVVGNTEEADRHAGQLVALERSLHLFVEGPRERPSVASNLTLGRKLRAEGSVSSGVFRESPRTRSAGSASGCFAAAGPKPHVRAYCRRGSAGTG